MSTVIVQVATAPTPFPAGTAPAGIAIALLGVSPTPDVTPTQMITAAPYEATFANVPPGTYTASAAALDASGNPLGAPAVSAQFTVEAPVSVDVPQTVTVTVQ